MLTDFMLGLCVCVNRSNDNTHFIKCPTFKATNKSDFQGNCLNRINQNYQRQINIEIFHSKDPTKKPAKMCF
jgi:hypothetical protein